jgi:glycosyltransferase involved in cell wall biosynthesis
VTATVKTWRRGKKRDRRVPAFQPALMADVELSRPLRLIACDPSRDVERYERAIVLVRLHTHPLGVVEIHQRLSDVTPADLAGEIWRSLAREIVEHLRVDGWSEGIAPPTEGYVTTSPPPCLERRSQALETAPFISVVVPTRERTEQLRSCLASIFALRYPRYEVIVVDNAPRTAATEELVKGFAAGAVPVTYLREPRRGASAARNRGLRSASGELVAFADDDVVVDPHWLAAISEAFDVTDDVGCVTGPVLPLHFETPAQAWTEQFAEFRTGFAQELFDLREHRSQRPLYPYNPGVFGSGGSMAFRKETLREVGGFDTALGPATPARSGEELAAFIGVILRGHRLVFEPAALVRHAETLDYDGLRRRAYAYGVGLSAYLTKTLVDHPGLVLDVATKLPYAAYLMFSPRSPKHARRSRSFPRELNAVELCGILSGPFAYLLARARSRAGLIARSTGERAFARARGTSRQARGTVQ